MTIMGLDLHGEDGAPHDHPQSLEAIPDEESPLLSDSDSPEPKIKTPAAVGTIVAVLLLGGTHTMNGGTPC